MSKTLRLSLALLLATSPLALSSSNAAEAPAAKTLAGTYVWDQGEEMGNLRAVFTPDGENHWKVDFHFEFQGKQHTYSGTADGQLSQGAFSGRVETDRRSRTFSFKGEFKDGKFKGTHADVSGGGEEKTGTLTLG